jgi:DNA-binding response OmpR family regulator
LPRILVLDDEPLVTMLVEDWLAELGCEVVGPARSVQEALDYAGNALLDAAILDVNLGGQNSFSVADTLRQRGIPFAFITGNESIDPDSGFANPILLAKPFDFEGVKAIVRKLLR